MKGKKIVENIQNTQIRGKNHLKSLNHKHINTLRFAKKHDIIY